MYKAVDVSAERYNNIDVGCDDKVVFYVMHNVISS